MPDACLPSTHLERSGGLPPRTCRLEKNEWLARRACHGGGIRLLGCCSWRRLGGRREKGEQWDFVFAPAVVSMRRAGNSRGDLAARTKRLDGTKKKGPAGRWSDGGGFKSFLSETAVLVGQQGLEGQQGTSGKVNQAADHRRAFKVASRGFLRNPLREFPFSLSYSLL